MEPETTIKETEGPHDFERFDFKPPEEVVDRIIDSLPTGAKQRQGPIIVWSATDDMKIYQASFFNSTVRRAKKNSRDKS